VFPIRPPGGQGGVSVFNRTRTAIRALDMGDAFKDAQRCQRSPRKKHGHLWAGWASLGARRGRGGGNMTVTGAREVCQRAGSVMDAGGRRRLRFAKSMHTELRPAIETLKTKKAEALAQLAQSDSAELPPIEQSLKGRAVELWRDGSRFFLVADDEDALEAM